MFSVTTWQKLLWLELQEAQENPFLKISKTSLQKENQMHPMYTSILGWLQNHWKLQMSKNSSKLENKWPQNAAIQSYIVYKKSNFKSDEHPTPSNTCWLHSRQKVHVRHKGTAPYRSALRGLPKLPFQPANNPITLLGIAQCKTPVTTDAMQTHNEGENDMQTPRISCTCMQHHSSIQIFPTKIIHCKNLLPLAAVHVKKKLLWWKPSHAKYFST